MFADSLATKHTAFVRVRALWDSEGVFALRVFHTKHTLFGRRLDIPPFAFRICCFVRPFVRKDSGVAET